MTQIKTEDTRPSLTALLGRTENTIAALSSESLIRVAAGLFLMPHGAQKLFGWFGGYGLTATGQFFEQQLGYSNGVLAAFGAGFVEFFVGLSLALGLFTRLSALAVTVLLLTATTVHLSAGFFWTSGGYEYPLLWALISAIFIIRGGNQQSLDHLIRIKLKL